MPIPSSQGWSLAQLASVRKQVMILLSAKTYGLLAMMSVTACQSLPGADGRYANFDRGQSNFRASLPAPGDTALLNPPQHPPRLILQAEGYRSTAGSNDLKGEAVR